MPRAGGATGESRWLSASEVGDYAYCPRSFWYRRHPPAGGPSAASRRSSAAGERFHAAYLSSEQLRSHHRGTWRTVLVIAVVVALACLVGAILS
ncbi:MAG: hypothetical protein L3K23_08135 [Thermoplasmata archaeon]|nr:hypothetical protein [Thermoplasmata archaeon]